MSEQTPPTPSSVDKIASALAKAQAEFIAPEKNKTVEVKNQSGTKLYSFDYADYGAIVESVRGPLSKNGICFTHLVETFGTGVRLVTRLIHSSGQMLETIYPLPMPNQDPKGFGGAVTYGKRYSLSAITGCVADDDVDESPADTQSFKDRGGAKGPISPPVKGRDFDEMPTQTPVKPKTPKAEFPHDTGQPTPGMLARLFAIGQENHWDAEQIRTYLGARWSIASTKALSREQYDQLIEKMQTTDFGRAIGEQFKE